MTKDEILKKYHQEKDEGKIFIESKSVLKGFTIMIFVGMFLITMSLLLTGEDTITNIVLILLLPFIFCFYGISAYYKKDKMYMFVSTVWAFIYVMRVFDFMKEFF